MYDWNKYKFVFKPPSPPKILMLVLASDNNPIYKEHQRIWRSYMHTNPNIDCYFYKGDPTLEQEYKLIEDTLYIQIEDTLENVYEKTLRAFKFFEPNFHKYKCIFRTNLSSVVIFHRYIEYCKTIPTHSFCSAHIGIENQVPFPAGAGFTITPDIASRLVAERPPLISQDDVSIGYALQSWGIPITSVNRMDFITPELYNDYHLKIPSIFHFRIKQLVRHIQNINTPYEIELMEKIVSMYYPSSFEKLKKNDLIL